MGTHMGQTCDGMTVVRSFQREAQNLEKTIRLINEANLTDKISSAAHEYYHRRLDWLSKGLYVLVGISCIGLRGDLAPIYLAMMFQYLEGVSH
jgi:ABC-type multidrug transport system fused ATPase/permease subunit